MKACIIKPLINPSIIGSHTSVGRGHYFILKYIIPLLVELKIANITLYDNFINGQDSKPFVNFLMMEETYSLFENMLNSDESFEA